MIFNAFKCEEIKMDITIRIAVLVTFVGLCRGQTLARGPCPTVKTVENFDLEKYDGRWYEHQRFYAIFQQFVHCSTAEYEILPSNMVVVNNTGFSTLTGHLNQAIGRAMVMNEEAPSKLGVRFGDQPWGNYWVLSTDYVNHSLVWSCQEIYMGLLGKMNAQLGWVLTRQPDGISDIELNRLMTLMKDQGINTEPFVKINQQNCPMR